MQEMTTKSINHNERYNDYDQQEDEINANHKLERRSSNV
jgi:hypothetical protein